MKYHGVELVKYNDSLISTSDNLIQIQQIINV